MTKSIFEPNPDDAAAVKKAQMSPMGKLILEMGPLVLFFFANYKGQWLIDNISFFSSFDKPIFPATAIFMVAIVVALILSWILTRTIPVMPLVSGIFVVFFGALTLWLHNDIFIKMKPTIINTLFGIILFGGLLFGRSLLGYVFDSAFRLDAEGWRKLTFRWACFFIFLAVLNEVIWRNFSDDFWANFKVWGTMPITIIFLILQTPLLARHSLDLKDNQDKS
ncbi:septation protein A [Bartonella sp. HY761]|nr:MULTISPECIES: septation protein A [unclassified Bartonella]UXN06360.1 septation protein A [Bartonella sp. HY761]